NLLLESYLVVPQIGEEARGRDFTGITLRLWRISGRRHHRQRDLHVVDGFIAVQSVHRAEPLPRVRAVEVLQFLAESTGLVVKVVERVDVGGEVAALRSAAVRTSRRGGHCNGGGQKP
ncbi:hypothetical protein PFISCL1PPCAC_8737, partial [Pristionchus fissidentatus]